MGIAYEVLVDLGRGGMADLAIAELTATGEQVIVKTLRPPATAQRVDMFLDEARLGVLFEHPNVVRTLATGQQQTDGKHFIVLELLDGQSADRLIARARAAATPPENLNAVLLWILAESLAGLHYAHELTQNGQPLNIVHRDFTPQNVFVTYDGRVKTLDFGIAKSTGRLSQTTTTGEVKGKIRYMAPEQALGMRIDRRADIFAAGIFLYELATGLPFWGDNVREHEIFDMLIAGDYAPDLRSVSDGMARIITKALARDALERYRTADEMRRDLLVEITQLTGKPVLTIATAEVISQLFADQHARITNAIQHAKKLKAQ